MKPALRKLLFWFAFTLFCLILVWWFVSPFQKYMLGVKGTPNDRLVSRLFEASTTNVSDLGFFSSIVPGPFDFQIGVDMSIPVGSKAGLILNLDNPENPRDFVAVYLDRAEEQLYFQKCFHTPCTTVFHKRVRYSDGARLLVIKSGKIYAIYYANTLVQSQRIWESGLTKNTNHATFSTGKGVLLRNFTMEGDMFVRLSFIGDSITAADNSYATYVALGLSDGTGNYHLYNHAIHGSRVLPVSQLGDMDKQVNDAASDDADIIIIELGTNDLNDETITKTYQDYLVVLKETNPRAHIYCMGILPRSSPEYRDVNNARIKQACRHEDVSFWDTEGWIDPSIDTDDGVHPNEQGHRKIAEKVLELLA